MTNNAALIQPGDFLSETLVTDTRVWYVVSTTAKTVTIAPARSGEVVSRCGDANMTVSREALAPEAPYDTRTLRLRKDGTYRTHRSGHALHLITGKPTSSINYAY